MNRMGQSEQASKWSLVDLFPEPAAQDLEAALAKLEQAVCEFEAMREVLRLHLVFFLFRGQFSMTSVVKIL